MLAREVRYATEELAMAHARLALALDASTDDLGLSSEGRSVIASVFIRGVRAATVRYARRLEEAIDNYEGLDPDECDAPDDDQGSGVS
jgi:hypothetical protein